MHPFLFTLKDVYTFNAQYMPLTKISSYNSNTTSSEERTYDALGRVTKTIETVGSETYQVDYTYTNGRLTKTVHSPMAYTINYLYNTYGYLNKLTDVNNTALRTIFYLDGSPYTATVALENNNGTTRLLYINRDNIGSITHITNASKVLQAEYSYDAWGRMRNPANLALYAFGSDPALLLNRGYTGHEHTKEFNLINMNARLYDAIVGRMLSPDNYVQDPINPMHFNRYTYVLNNPMKYNDPSGNMLEIFLSKLLGKVMLTSFVDFMRTGFTRGGFEFWNWRSQNFRTAWREFDPGRTGSRTNNAVRIMNGTLFEGNIGQIASRWTKELPQTLIGYEYGNLANIMGRVTDVNYFRGSTIMNVTDIPFDNDQADGVTFGSFIMGEGIAANPFEVDAAGRLTAGARLLHHEYGHYLQSQRNGWSYLGKYGIPSAGGADWTEVDAEFRSDQYFRNEFGAAPAFTSYPANYRPVNTLFVEHLSFLHNGYLGGSIFTGLLNLFR
ncbi:MAG: hypothetical protein KF862_10555 [Chitinophagaceae bacterium]|nr:hypothetical protein [Chitinophagaceae bacterium]